MKYKIKYLINTPLQIGLRHLFSDYVRIYNIDNYELIDDCFEVNIGSYIRHLFNNDLKYCISVTYGGKDYLGISERDLKKFRNIIETNECYFNLFKGYKLVEGKIAVKTIKEVIIEQIVG